MTPQRGGRWRDHRQVIDGILFRVRSGVPWRDVPARYGPWKTLYKRFARWEEDGTRARIEGALQADADAVGELDWNAHADSTIVRTSTWRSVTDVDLSMYGDNKAMPHEAQHLVRHSRVRPPPTAGHRPGPSKSGLLVKVSACRRLPGRTVKGSLYFVKVFAVTVFGGVR
jgi:transposase